jgi:hypothetical protein
MSLCPVRAVIFRWGSNPQPRFSKPIYPVEHAPIIDEGLFFKVQEIIKGKKPLNTAKSTVREEFPLRGFLQCCKCGKPLTGSTGLGKLKKRYYLLPLHQRVQRDL